MSNWATAVAAILVLAVAATGQTTLPAEGDALDTAEEEALAQELYGRKIAEVRATATPDDDLSLGRILLEAAEDDKNPAKLRLVLARTCMDVLAAAGGEETMSLYRQALATVDGLRPMGRIERARLLRDVLLRRFEQARSAREAPAKLLPLAREAARGYLGFAEAVAGSDADDQIDAGIASANAAGGLARSYRLGALLERSEALMKELRRLKSRSLRLKAALARVAQAKRTGNEQALATARRATALLYLTLDGDLAAAAEHIEGTGDPSAPAVLAGAAFLKDPTSLNAKTALESVGALTDLARQLDKAPKLALCDCAYRMCRAYLATNPEGIDAARARLRLLELKGILQITEADKLLKKLNEAYKTLHCKLATLEAGGVRVTYDFSAPEQIKDWQTDQAQWTVANGVLACKTGTWDAGSTTNKLLFRMDRPFKITLTGRASYAFTVTLAHRPPGQSYVYYTHDFGIHRYYGLRSDTFSSYWRDSARRLTSGQPYRFEITGDGQGGFTWAIDGTKIRTSPPPTSTYASYAKGTFQLRLYTERSSRLYTAFDQVVIEGDVVVPGPD